MKQIYKSLTAVLAFGLLFSACREEMPFSTASADDEPRILDPTFPDRGSDGSLPVIRDISRDGNLNIALTVTPADYTTVVWYIDGDEVATGKEIDCSLKAGVYHLKVVVSTDAGKSTYREGTVNVKPLADDPYSDAVAFERYVTPGKTAKIFGQNLDKAKAVVIGEVSAAATYNAADGCLEYEVPTDLPEGEYRIVLADAEGNEYGANKVVVTASSLIYEGAGQGTAGFDWEMKGLNLENVASVRIGDTEITEISHPSENSIIFVCPQLEEGEYAITGKDRSGNAVMFLKDGALAESSVTVISSEKVLWEGHHYVSWDNPDGHPNKMFNIIGKEVFAGFRAGQTLFVTVSLEPSASYHKFSPATGWWSFFYEEEFAENKKFELALTQEVLDKIQAEDGFICAGHGYYVDKVTIL